MDIFEKLTQSKNSDIIYFYREGIFAQLYGVSLYLAINQLALPLTLRARRYKKLSDRYILCAGLPTKLLENLSIKNLQKTSFGYELKNDLIVDYRHYQIWYHQKLNQSLIEQNLLNRTQQINENLIRGLKPVWLNEKEYNFIQTWHRGKYRPGLELQFMEMLQRKIASSCA